jgi:intracellular sulfur oxidation DsrE/DsrF family protein
MGWAVMKRLLLLLCLALPGLVLVRAQDKSYRIVFDLTSRDTLDQKAVMRWVGEISKSNPEAQLEVVMYGKGFELVMPEKSAFMTEVNSAMKNPNVSFKVCQVALKSNNVERSRILADAHTVPDGIYEILMKQREGWGYIKVGH